MMSGNKFGRGHLLLSLGWGFAASLLLSIFLYAEFPEVLAGGPTGRAGSLEDGLIGMTISFWGGGFLFSLIAALAIAVRLKYKSAESRQGWWPTPHS
jgi:hypothetical protein